MQDMNNPARFLDTAYQALKDNPNATNQILQAAAQGAPVGLKGLAAAAAQQSQQEAQKAMVALRQQGPSPNIVQQLAHSGIMGQLNTGLPGAPQQMPSAPPPQGMASGGLVAFNRGGNVLPPDVIDAIQSHFADGGEVRGFAYGDEIMSLLRGVSDTSNDDEDILGPVADRWRDTIRHHIQTDKDILGPVADRWRDTIAHHVQTDKDVLGQAADRWKDTIRHHIQTDKNILGPIVEGLPQTWEDVTYPIGGPSERTAMPESDYRTLEEKGAFGPKPPGMLDRIASYISTNTPKSSALPQSTPDVETSPAVMSDEEKLSQLLEERPQSKTRKGEEFPAPRIWMPETPANQPDILPKPEVHPEGQKTDPAFQRAKQDTPSSATNPENQGLGGVEQAREMVDFIKGLYGEQKMSPEISKKLADLQDSARNSTILQTLLGGLAGGLSNPWGGRYALGSAALNALAGYQHGQAAESDLAKKAFEVERAYADEPDKMQQTAAKQYFDLVSEKAKLASAERTAEDRNALRELIFRGQEQGKNTRAELMVGQRGEATEGQKLAALNQAREQAAKDIKDKYLGATPPAGELERLTQQYYQNALSSIMATTSGMPIQTPQNATLGGGVLGSRSIIGGKLIGPSQ